MMALGDFTMYLALLSAIGWVPLVVTTNLTINFLRKPLPGDLIAEARLLKQTAWRGRYGRPHDLNLFNTTGKIIPQDQVIGMLKYSDHC